MLAENVHRDMRHAKRVAAGAKIIFFYKVLARAFELNLQTAVPEWNPLGCTAHV